MASNRPAVIALVLMALVALAPGASAGTLPTGVERVLKAARIPASAVSILVQAVDEKEPRLALNVDTPRNPASTAKLLTTWTALDMLGPTYTWPTQVYALGPIKDGVLHGDLLIKGFGDPYLVLEDFWKLVGEIRHLGVHDITGDLVLDDSLFQIDDTDPGAFDGRPDRLYNVLPNALLINFKAIDFILTAEPARSAVAITTVPELPILKISNHVRLTTGACRGNSILISMTAPDPNSPGELVFGGKMPASCGSYEFSRSVLPPDAYAYGAFRMLWRQWGGTLEGGFRRGVKPANARLLLTWRSRPLADIIGPLNKWSNNVMARLLLYGIGATHNHAPVTQQQAVATLLDHLAAEGLDTKGVVIENGAGLSRTTRVSARFMIDLLEHAWRAPTMPEFLASLSIVGEDGTTRRRFRGSPEAGRMHLKTGSLDDVSAIAGYVHAKRSGKTFAVCVLINHKGVNYGVGIDVQNAVLAWAFRQ